MRGVETQVLEAQPSSGKVAMKKSGKAGDLTIKHEDLYVMIAKLGNVTSKTMGFMNLYKPQFCGLYPPPYRSRKTCVWRGHQTLQLCKVYNHHELVTSMYLP
jgi:hypothetical protein